MTKPYGRRLRDMAHRSTKSMRKAARQQEKKEIRTSEKNIMPTNTNTPDPHLKMIGQMALELANTPGAKEPAESFLIALALHGGLAQAIIDSHETTRYTYNEQAIRKAAHDYLGLDWGKYGLTREHTKEAAARILEMTQTMDEHKNALTTGEYDG